MERATWCKDMEPVAGIAANEIGRHCGGVGDEACEAREKPNTTYPGRVEISLAAVNSEPRLVHDLRQDGRHTLSTTVEVGQTASIAYCSFVADGEDEGDLRCTMPTTLVMLDDKLYAIGAIQVGNCCRQVHHLG